MGRAAAIKGAEYMVQLLLQPGAEIPSIVSRSTQIGATGTSKSDELARALLESGRQIKVGSTPPQVCSNKGSVLEEKYEKNVTSIY
jgi:hypothetical protein